MATVERRKHLLMAQAEMVRARECAKRAIHDAGLSLIYNAECFKEDDDWTSITLSLPGGQKEPPKDRVKE